MKATRNSIHFNLFCSMSFKALFLLIVDIVTSTLVRFSHFQTRDFGSGGFPIDVSICHCHWLCYIVIGLAETIVGITNPSQ